MMKLESDVIVIGSGPLGAICARNLAEQGLSVTMLEAGPVISSPPGNHLRNQIVYQEHPDQFFEEIDRWCHLYGKNRPSEQLPGASITNAMGGQGLLWTTNCPRLQKHERWPAFTDDEWDALFSRAEKMLNVTQNLFDASIRQQNILNKLKSYLTSNRPLGKVPIAAKKVQHYIQFTATQEILDMEPNFKKNIQIKMNVRVSNLRSHNKQIEMIDIVQDGKSSALKANCYIVAGGIFETVQLLYNSFIRPKALGHYLHFHSLYTAQLVLHPELAAHFENDAPPRVCIYPTLDHPWHAMILRDIFPDLSAERIPENQLVEMQYFVPSEIHKNNKMILSTTPPNFLFHYSEKDRQMMQQAKMDLEKTAEVLGRYRRGCEPALVSPGFAHPMGLCRAGEDPATSVTNYVGKVHDHDNLYIASVGQIPTSIGVNPTLTGAALALATTDFIAKKSFPNRNER